MKALIFAPDSGNQYAEFQREAKAFAKFLGDAEVLMFPASKPDAERRKFVLAALDGRRGRAYGIVAFLCHGYRTGIQAGFYMAHAFDLALRIRACATVAASVPLYACSTGKGPGTDADGVGDGVGAGEGGFADTLRDQLAAQGMRGGTVLSHYSPGHLSRNPETRIFYIGQGQNGGYDVAPRSVNLDLYRRFRGLLHTPTGRWEIATMTGPEIEMKALTCEPWTK